jgi:hypothetical protein
MGLMMSSFVIAGYQVVSEDAAGWHQIFRWCRKYRIVTAKSGTVADHLQYDFR